MLIYTALYVPFKLAFAAGLEETEVYMGKVDWIVDFIFIADLFVNFLTSYEKRDGLMEVRVPYIAKNYLRGWFIIDFFACFPVQLIEPILKEAGAETSDGEFNNLLKLAKVPRFYRLIRVFRLIRLFRFSRSLRNVFKLMNINAGVGKLVTVLITVFFMVHLIACVWYGIAEFSDFEADSWVVRKGLTTRSVTEKYVNAWYWSF